MLMARFRGGARPVVVHSCDLMGSSSRKKPGCRKPVLYGGLWMITWMITRLLQDESEIRGGSGVAAGQRSS